MSETIHFQLRAPAALVGALDDLAVRSGRSRNAEIVAALEAHARAQGAGTGLEAGLVETHAAYRAHRDRLREALAGLALDVPRASLICDALNGVHMLYGHAELGPSAGSIALEVHDAIRLAQRDVEHGVEDGQALVRRLAAMTPLEALAVADAAERFWAAVASGSRAAGEETLRAVGLVQG